MITITKNTSGKYTVSESRGHLLPDYTTKSLHNARLIAKERANGGEVIENI